MLCPLKYDYIMHICNWPKPSIFTIQVNVSSGAPNLDSRNSVVDAERLDQFFTLNGGGKL